MLASGWEATVEVLSFNFFKSTCFSFWSKVFFSNIHSILHPWCTKRLMTTTYSLILTVKIHIIQSYPNTGPKVLDPALLLLWPSVKTHFLMVHISVKPDKEQGKPKNAVFILQELKYTWEEAFIREMVLYLEMTYSWLLSMNETWNRKARRNLILKEGPSCLEWRNG